MDIIDQLTFRDPPNICATTMSGFSSGTRSDYDEGLGACCCPGKKWKNFYQKWNGIRICLICTKQLITNEPLRQLFPQKFGGVNTGIHEASLKQESTNRFVVLAGMIIVIILVIIIIVIIMIIVISLRLCIFCIYCNIVVVRIYEL